MYKVLCVIFMAELPQNRISGLKWQSFIVSSVCVKGQSILRGLGASLRVASPGSAPEAAERELKHYQD